MALDKLNTSNNNGIQNVRLSAENLTDFLIDLAVIDVQYYDVNGRYQKGETVYVKNILPRQDVTVKIPDNRNAASVHYKVSLISSEEKTLYIIAD